MKFGELFKGREKKLRDDLEAMQLLKQSGVKGALTTKEVENAKKILPYRRARQAGNKGVLTDAEVNRYR